MISLYKKKGNISFSLNLEKEVIFNSVVDNFKNELLFPGSMTVTIDGIEPNNVSWDIIDETSGSIILNTYTGNQTINNLKVGRYRIKFSDQDGYIKPSDIIKIVGERSNIIVSPRYIRNAGNVQIHIDSNLKTFDTEQASWVLSGLDTNYIKIGNGISLLEELNVGNYICKFEEVDGFQTPSNTVTKIEAEKTKVIVGNYNILCDSIINPSCTSEPDAFLFFNFNSGDSGITIDNITGRIINKTKDCSIGFVGTTTPEMVTDNFQFSSGIISLEFDNFNINDYLKDLWVSVGEQRYYYDERTGEYGIDINNITLSPGEFLVINLILGSNEGIR